MTRSVFISYDTREVAIASWLKRILAARLPAGVQVFVAKHDIAAGADPMRVMLDENLLQAEALVALCSKLSRTSPWLWWESGSVWGRGKLVVPLFIDVTPAEFGGPIQIVRQGRAASDHAEVNSLVETVVRQFDDHASVPALSEAERASLDIALAKAAKAGLEGPTLDMGALYELLSRKGGGGIRFADLALELGSKPSIVRKAVEQIAQEGFIQVYVMNDDEVVFNLPTPQGG